MSRDQLVDLGFTDKAIQCQLAAQRWQRVYAGVYVVHTGPLPFVTKVWAALLRAGPGATASHQTAAFLDGLDDEPGEVIHITVPISRRVGRIEGVRVHYATHLDTTRHPAKQPPRTRVEDTVLDLIDTSSSVAAAATWVTRACQRRKSTPARLARALSQRKKISWRAATEAMVVDVAEGAQSPLEVEYLRAVERCHRLPRADRNPRLAGRRVIWIDCDYPEFTARVELDGRVGHMEEGAFRDRKRDNRGVVHRVGTLRYGYVEVFGEPCAVAAEVAGVLQDRGWSGHPRRCGPACSIP